MSNKTATQVGTERGIKRREASRRDPVTDAVCAAIGYLDSFDTADTADLIGADVIPMSPVEARRLLYTWGEK